MKLISTGVRVIANLGEGTGHATFHMPAGVVQRMAIRNASATDPSAVTVSLDVVSDTIIDTSGESPVPMSQHVWSTDGAQVSRLAVVVDEYTFGGTATVSITNGLDNAAYVVTFWVEPARTYVVRSETDGAGAFTFTVPHQGGVFQSFIVEYDEDDESGSDTSFVVQWDASASPGAAAMSNFWGDPVTLDQLQDGQDFVLPPGTITLTLTGADPNAKYRTTFHIR